MHPITKTLVTLVSSLGLAAAPLIGMAADAVPSYSAPSHEDSIKGTVTSFDGHFDLDVRDDRGFIDHVRLHEGTIINPTGLTLAPGQHVTVLGANAGNVLSANEIDTPYTETLVAYPAYGFGGYPYPGYGFGYGPYYSSFGFGFGGGFHHFR